jgi:methylthioribose-1-phosphate isomerase
MRCTAARSSRNVLGAAGGPEDGFIRRLCNSPGPPRGRCRIDDVTDDELSPVRWHCDAVRIVDQTALPGEVRIIDLTSCDDVVDAIRRLAVRGAPAIGVCGAFGVALVAQDPAAEASLGAAAERIAAARPTAANLRWAVERVMSVRGKGPDAMLAEAIAISDEAAAASQRMGALGADLLESLVPHRPMTIQTHCNTGGLACLGRGTALAAVHALHERSLVREVFVDETRPLLQGARLTAYELTRWRIPHRVVVDGAGPALLAAGRTDAVVLGADRIAANGDVANKVGTYALALAAQRAGVPFVVVAPESTVDPATPTGADIAIEERDAAEVLRWPGVDLTPGGTDALNIAFDVTPAELVTAIVTEARVVRPAAGDDLRPF